MNYRETLNLPRDVLPMRANLPQREPEFQRFWEEREIYRKSVEREPQAGTFLLHDGPPYSNGDIHIGHALNKILKDIITRQKTMQGFRAPYIPGWDNHGMPIEYAVSQQARENGETLTRVDLRARCREYAQRFIDVQREQFRRLGLRGAWDRPYLTMAPEFEARIVEVFAELAGRGFVYRGIRPVLWCPHDETALAEAELEYEEKTSPSITVRFPLMADPGGLMPAGEDCYTLIWTTTPWTIPANLAVAFHPDFDYVVARLSPVGESRSGFYLLAEGLLQSTLRAVGADSAEVLSRWKGRDLLGMVFRHPLHELDPVFDRPSPVVLADYVTLETGTGVVHTAPGHGEEDFRTGREYGLEILCPVDAGGRFTREAGPFAGLAIRPGDADRAVLKALSESGHLLHREPYRHKYPHCWRCHGPLIFRATSQWFMRIDHVLPDGATQRQRMLDAIQKVRWIPAESVRRIEAMAGGRPDWCLSRQRAWGVGIPIFFCKACGEAIHTPDSLAAAVRMVRERGADAWFTAPAAEILPDGFRCPHCAEAGPFEKETDVLDVWFDSGSTWNAVLESGFWPELSFPADLYIEGSDQHRGWFNSSLTLATALRGTAPYRAVLSHGFTLDPNGEKMAKSKGNVVSPQEEIEKGGADILRLWVSSVDYFEDVRIGGPILEHVRNVFLRIRNTLRFLVGNLYDFDPARDLVPAADRLELDRWPLHRLSGLVETCTRAYDAYVYHDLFREVQNFCAVDLGAFYLDVIKDRLYCSAAGDPARRSAQSTLHDLADTLARLLAPILVHVSEEVWQAIPGATARYESVHLAPLPEPQAAWRDDGLGARYERLRDVRDQVNAAIELLKPAKGREGHVLKSSLEAAVRLSGGPDWAPLLQESDGQLPALLMVPAVEVVPRSEAGLEVAVSRASGRRCERCWLVLPDVGSAAADLCSRCSGVLSGRPGPG